MLEKSLKQEVKAQIIEKREMEKRKNVKTNSISLALSNNQNCNTRNKNNHFLGSKVRHAKKVSTEILMLDRRNLVGGYFEKKGFFLGVYQNQNIWDFSEQ